MIWTVSDLMILLLTAALVINAAGGAALFLCRKLERFFDQMAHFRVV